VQRLAAAAELATVELDVVRAGDHRLRLHLALGQDQAPVLKHLRLAAARYRLVCNRNLKVFDLLLQFHLKHVIPILIGTWLNLFRLTETENSVNRCFCKNRNRLFTSKKTETDKLKIQ